MNRRQVLEMLCKSRVCVSDGIYVAMTSSMAYMTDTRSGQVYSVPCRFLKVEGSTIFIHNKPITMNGRIDEALLRMYYPSYGKKQTTKGALEKPAIVVRDKSLNYTGKLLRCHMVLLMHFGSPLLEQFDDDGAYKFAIYSLNGSVKDTRLSNLAICKTHRRGGVLFDPYIQLNHDTEYEELVIGLI